MSRGRGKVQVVCLLDRVLEIGWMSSREAHDWNVITIRLKEVISMAPGVSQILLALAFSAVQGIHTYCYKDWLIFGKVRSQALTPMFLDVGGWMQFPIQQLCFWFDGQLQATWRTSHIWNDLQHLVLLDCEPQETCRAVPKPGCTPKGLNLFGGIPKWHLFGHKQVCHVQYSLNFVPHCGQMNGEGPE